MDPPNYLKDMGDFSTPIMLVEISFWSREHAMGAIVNGVDIMGFSAHLVQLLLCLQITCGDPFVYPHWQIYLFFISGLTIQSQSVKMAPPTNRWKPPVD